MNESGERLRAWTAVDELVLDICTMTKSLAAHGHEDVPATLRGLAIKSALRTTLAVQGRGSEYGPSLRAALTALGELRYFLYLARRLGLIEARRYRAACVRHERAQRTLRDLLDREGGTASPAAEAAPSPYAIESSPEDPLGLETRKEA